jgi:hypothetical protein
MFASAFAAMDLGTGGWSAIRRLGTSREAWFTGMASA